MGAIVISRAAISDLTEGSHRVLSRYSDVIEITDGLHRLGDIVSFKKRTRCKLLLGLGVRSTQFGTDHSVGSDARRLKRLKNILPYFDYVELDGERDLVDDILNLVPPQKRLITWRYHKTDARFLSQQLNSTDIAVPERASEECNALVESFRDISRLHAFLYRFISSNGITALEFLYTINQESAKADKTIAYAEGAEEIWSRIAAAYIGAKVVFADSVRSDPAALESLVRQFGLPDLPVIDHLYGISGDSVIRSLSPAIHNAAFRQLGYPALYLPFPAKSMDALLSLVERLAHIGLVINGLTMTSPLKEATSERFIARRKIVNQARSANVLRLEQSRGRVDTTDDLGLKAILDNYEISVKGKRVAVTGCGGSGRVAAQMLTGLRAHVVMYNRGSRRAKLASELLNLRCYPLSEFKPDDVDIIVNTVPFPGSHDANLPFSITGLNPDSVLVDYSYSAAPNVLVIEARRRGVTVIDGLVMLEKQLCAQFKCLTDNDMPADIISNTLQSYRDRSATKLEPIEHVSQNRKIKLDVPGKARKTNANPNRKDAGSEFHIAGIATGR